MFISKFESLENIITYFNDYYFKCCHNIIIKDKNILFLTYIRVFRICECYFNNYIDIFNLYNIIINYKILFANTSLIREFNLITIYLSNIFNINIFNIQSELQKIYYYNYPLNS